MSEERLSTWDALAVLHVSPSSTRQEVVRPQIADPQLALLPAYPRNRHHLLFPKKPWSAQLETKKLRQHPNLIVEMDETVEAELHKEVTLVPLLGVAMARRVLRDFTGTPQQPLQSIHELMARIEQASRLPGVREYERQLGELTVHCLDLQRPFLD